MWVLLLVLQCVAGDLAAGRPASGTVAKGDPAQLTAPAALPDGTAWDAPGTVVLQRGGAVVVDLGEPRAVGAVALQADDDDAYLLEGSLDERSWSVLWSAPPSSRGPGLRTRRHALDRPAEVRYLRIHGRGGDGRYAVGRVRVFCEKPAAWPDEPSPWHPVALWQSLDNDSILVVKGALAVAGAVLLAAGAWLRRRGRDATLRRTRDALLAVLGVAGFAGWFNLFHFHFEEFLHPWDIYHYYIGAKYLPELGYTRMYECTTVAEAEVFGAGAVAGRTIRNLVTNELEPAAPAVADPARCTSRFTPERWRAFRDDIAVFRSFFSTPRWLEVLHDHGYNGTPVWGLVGRALASLGPASPAQVTALALIDPALLVLLWVAVAWAFGWRTACVGLLFWGTNFPARYWWNGGAYLREDWLFLAVVGICLVRRGRPAAGGAALAWSTLLRVFPGFIFVGLFGKLVAVALRERRLVVTREQRRLVVGALAAALVLVPAALAAGGLDAAAGFVDNSRKHLATPLTNNVGWKTVVAYQTETRARVEVGRGGTDPYGAWKEARRQVFATRLPIYLAGLVAFLLLVGWAAGPLPDWAALVLGVGVIPFAAELTCYYYSILLCFALLWERRASTGVGLLVLAAATCVVPRIAYWEDARYFDVSVQVLVFVVLATFVARPSARDA